MATQFCGCMIGPNDPDPKCPDCYGTGHYGETLQPFTAVHDRGRRDMLNALLSPNPSVAAKVAELMDEGGAPNPEGKLPFVVVLWITSVADQLGIEPKDGAS